MKIIYSNYNWADVETFSKYPYRDLGKVVLFHFYTPLITVYLPITSVDGSTR